MSGAVALTLAARGPFRLAAVTVSHGWFQTAPFSWQAPDGPLRRVEPLDGAAVTLTIAPGDGGVRVCSSAPLGDAALAQARGRVSRMLQLDCDLEGFPEAVREVDPGLAADLQAYGGGRVLAGASLFEDVIKGICGTNITWRQASAAINRIAARGRDGAFPGPADILRGGEEWLREQARVGYRAGPLVAAARAAIDGTLAEIEADARSGDGARADAALRRLAGVGPATAGFLVLLMGHFDRPVVDAATLRVAAGAWFGGRRPAPREVLRRVAPAGRFAGLVLAWATLRAWQRESGLAPGA